MLDTTFLRDRAEGDRDLLSETVEHTVRKHLGDDKIVSVESSSGEDFDGDEIIAITVVINIPPSKFASRSLSSLVRILRSSLAEIGIFSFPMVRYMTEAEQRTRRR